MKKLWKKGLVAFLALTLIFQLIPGFANAADSRLKDGGEYQVQVNFYKDNTGKQRKNLQRQINILTIQQRLK